MDREEVEQAQIKLASLKTKLIHAAGDFVTGAAKRLGKGAQKGVGLVTGATKAVGGKVGDTAKTMYAGKHVSGGLESTMAILGLTGAVGSMTPYGTEVLNKIPGVGLATNVMNPLSSSAANLAYDANPVYQRVMNQKMAPKVNSSYTSVNRGMSTPLSKNMNQFTKTGGSMFYGPERLKQYAKMRTQLEKNASVRALRKNVLSAKGSSDFATNALLYLTGATALGVTLPMAANAVGEGISYARRGRLNRDYEEMTKVDPSLKRDPMSKEYFKVLHESSPYVAQRPVIAATVIRNLVDSPQLDGRKFKEILEIEKMRLDTKNPIMRGTPNSIAKMPTMPMGFGGE